MWTCPKCKRQFKRKGQTHGCRLISKDALFIRRRPELKLLYQKIAAVAKTFGLVREETVPPDVIFFKTDSTFLAVKVKKDHLDIEFFLDHRADAPRVLKFLQTSKHRFVHLVPIDEEEDIDDQLVEWMRASYDLIKE